MEMSEQIKTLVNQIADVDNGGVFYGTGGRKKKPKGQGDKTREQLTKDAEDCRAIIKKIYATGRAGLLALLDLLVEPGKGDDYKAHYALHCLAVHICTLPGKEGRAGFAQTLAGQLGGPRPKGVQKFLIQELESVGGKEVVAALGKMLGDADLCEPAARALVAIGAGAGEQLCAALPKATGKCRLTIIQNLGVVAEPTAVGHLRKAVTDGDQDVRLAAGWALANLGDEGSADLLVKAAGAKATWERVRGAKACLLLAEKLQAAGKKAEAKKVYQGLKNTQDRPEEKYIRDLAVKALG